MTLKQNIIRMHFKESHMNVLSLKKHESLISYGQEEFEGTKGVIRIRISMNDRDNPMATRNKDKRTD